MRPKGTVVGCQWREVGLKGGDICNSKINGNCYHSELFRTAYKKDIPLFMSIKVSNTG